MLRIRQQDLPLRGSSHNFAKFFGESDSSTLKTAGFTTHYTEDRDQAATDDAIGPRDGHGLGHMAERAARLGAQLQVTSQPDAGAETRLALPLPGRQ